MASIGLDLMELCQSVTNHTTVKRSIATGLLSCLTDG